MERGPSKGRGSPLRARTTAEESGAGTDPSRRSLTIGLASEESASRPAVNRLAEVPCCRADRVATACVAPHPPREIGDLEVNQKVPPPRKRDSDHGVPA